MKSFECLCVLDDTVMSVEISVLVQWDADELHFSMCTTLTRTSCTLHLSVTDTSSKRFIVQPYFWLILPKFAQIQWLVNSVLVTGLCFCIIRVTCLILLAGTNSSSVILLEIWCVGFVWVLLRCSRLKLCSHDENGWRSERLNWSCWFEEHECFGLESFLCSSSQDDFALL